ncbi:MAG: hypothetical protein ACFFB2_19955 [Promethearchaeota archaeon]
MPRKWNDLTDDSIEKLKAAKPLAEVIRAKSKPVTPDELHRVLLILINMREETPIFISQISELTGIARIKPILDHLLEKDLIEGEFLSVAVRDDVFIKKQRKGMEKENLYTEHDEQNKIMIDLLNRKAILISAIRAAFECTEIDIPSRIKSLLKNPQKNLLTLRNGLFLIEMQSPKFICQLCLGEISAKTYFQCVTCKRYTCTTHYVESQKVGYDKCTTCGNKMIFFPFMCEGCQLDFSSVDEIKGKNCPLCGFFLPDQKKLISTNIKTVPSSQMDPSQDFTDVKK